MPSKYVSKDRAWGTRYDSLGSSPPPSPPYRQIQTSLAIPHSPPTSVAAGLSQSSSGNFIVPHSNSFSSLQEKMPHDASVFVGSLPIDVEPPELTRLLHDHLSAHTEVRNIKVVRDNRGGTCAFVQCENAVTAARLINTLQSSPPRPFLGRILRYEPARAFRMLLISYRRPSTVQELPIDPTSDANSKDTPGLPDAIRVYRSQNSKFLSLSYNAEAREFENKLARSPLGCADSRDAFDGAGVLLDPLNYDAETIFKLASAFGPVEHFSVYNPYTESDTPFSSQYRPYPHTAPCAPGMETQIWEVKWGHRDDCVNALMTLRHATFLTVSWAHHAIIAPGPGHDSRCGNLEQFPNARIPFSAHHQATSQPCYRKTGESPRQQKCLETTMDVAELTMTHIRTETSPGGSISQPWSFAHSTPFMRESSTPIALGSPRLSNHIARQLKSPKWSETDFPALGIPNSGERISFTHERDTRPWGDRDNEDDGLDELDHLPEGPAVSESPASSSSVNPSSFPAESDPQSHITNGCRLSTSLPMSPVQSPGTKMKGQGHALTHSPEFSTSSIVPLTPPTVRTFPPALASPTTRSSILEVPHDDTSTLHRENIGPNTPKRLSVSNGRGDYDGAGEPQRQVDPSTIFVGGLEMYGPSAWNEAKLRLLFGRFGHIESIQVVRPTNQRSAFAFIKFSDIEASARAVREEHNRIHDGRQIRVQLRDSNPPSRSPWRNGRGRGRLLSAGYLRSYDGVSGGKDHPITLEKLGTVPPFKPLTTMLLPSKPGDHFSPSGPVAQNEPTHAGMSISDLSSLSSSTTKASFPHPDVSRNQATSVSPASMASAPPPVSVSGTNAQYPMPNMGYFTPQPWIHPYPQYYPYPVSYIQNHPGFPVVAQQGTHTAGANEVNSGGPSAWPVAPHFYTPMIPYIAYPAMLPNNDRVHSSGHGVPQSGVQPPLKATGFFQGEQGMLIPVYQPEALHHYMSSAEQSHSPPPNAPPQTSASVSWPSVPQVSTYPYPSHEQSATPLTSQPPQAIHQRGWVPSPASHRSHASQHHGPSHHVTGPYMLPASSTNSLSGTSSFRGSHPNASQSMQHFGYCGTPPPPRRSGRQDSIPPSHQFHRLSNSCSFPSQYVKPIANSTADSSYNLASEAS
ncbi:uncharacterized protein FIBRA_00118 [Fibroporia radiculosa]|uniref:RRM domain-containing protein n=1 Tax=Fibroporia radiculosa TaxID=599839 RepID=J7S5N6_9APHY|nr:uncharacterized protein FIBRA_00118 [Fibroporia radiculosa]CCL98124.1 predicted protein [Fibroporia radiculosa]